MERREASAAPTTELDGAAELERFAVELAHLAGDEIVRSLESEIAVAYKDEGGSAPPRDAVTNVDREVEQLLLERVVERYPGHGFLGEEGLSRESRDGITWVVDPIDGTQNFVNALPIYSSSVAALADGLPAAGAIWGAATHRIGPGVYHAHAGGPLHLDGAIVTESRPARNRRRGIGQLPHDEDHHLRPDTIDMSPHRPLPYDRRHIGSGALEAAFVAAGVLQAAYNTGPRSWDIAAGIVLAQAAGRGVWIRDGARWIPFERFDLGEIEALRTWRRPVLLATHEMFRALGWRMRPE